MAEELLPQVVAEVPEALRAQQQAAPEPEALQRSALAAAQAGSLQPELAAAVAEELLPQVVAEVPEALQVLFDQLAPEQRVLLSLFPAQAVPQA